MQERENPVQEGFVPRDKEKDSTDKLEKTLEGLRREHPLLLKALESLGNYYSHGLDEQDTIPGLKEVLNALEEHEMSIYAQKHEIINELNRRQSDLPTKK